MKPIRYLAVLTLATGSVAAALPDPEPPFQPKDGKRQAVALKTYDVETRSNKVGGTRSVESANLRSGNKQLSFRSKLFDADETFEIHIGDKSIGMGKVFAMEAAKGAVAALAVDKAAQSITSSQEYVVSAGKTARLSYTLRPLGEGKIAMDWAWASPAEGGLGFCFFINGSHYRAAGVHCNDTPLALVPLDELSATPRLLKDVKGPARLVVAPASPLQSFGVEIGPEYSVSLMEQNGAGDSTLRIWIHAAKTVTKGTLVIDLGVTAVTAPSAPPPVGKVDFWARDATHVPAPTTRNLKANPSFEQGLRYWTFWGGGGTYLESNTPAYAISNDARFGNQSLLVRREGGGHPIMSFPIPVEKGADYTVSFYAKAAQDKTSLSLGVQSALRSDGSKMGWQEALKCHHQITTAWQRYVLSFKSDTAAVAVMIAPGGSPVWIDGLQVERGMAPTDYTGPALEGALRTSDPDGMVAAGQIIDASFELSGKPATAGGVALSLFDFYRERRFQQKVAFTLDRSGRAAIKLPLDALQLGSGVFILRADYVGSPGTELEFAL